MKFTIRTFAVLALSLLFTSSCDVQKQLAQLANLVKCEYRLANLSNINLGGVSLQGKSSLANLTVAEGVQLATAYAQGNMPLSMNINIDVKNKEKEPAALSKLDYKVALDGQQITTGSLNQAFSVAGGATSTLPIGISIDLKQALSGKTKDALLNLALSLAGQSQNPTKVGLQVRPYFTVRGQTVQFPNYFTVNTTFKEGSL